MKDLGGIIDNFLLRRPIPFVVFVAPAAEKMGAAARAASADGQIEVRAFDAAKAQPPSSPNILVLAPKDLVSGDTTRALLAHARAARPARPVLFGGARNRDVLVDAINTWRVFRVVPEQTPEVLRDALTQAYQAMCVELTLKRLGGDLVDETTQLEQTLANLRATQQRVIELERGNVLGRAASSLMPVITSHLNALETFKVIASASLHRDDPELRDMLTSAFEGVAALRTMLEDLLTYAESTPAPGNPAVVNLDETVASALAFGRFDPLANGRPVQTTLQSGIAVLFDRDRLRQVVLNLLRSAYQIAAPKEPLTVRTLKKGQDGVLEVESNGAPISEDARAQLFDPAFRLGGDAGLGLSPCRLMVERYGGSISCINVPGRGPCFRVRLPRAPS